MQETHVQNASAINPQEKSSATLLDELDFALEELDLHGNGVILKAHPWMRIGRRKFEAKVDCFFPEIDSPEQTVRVTAGIGENFGSLRMQAWQTLYPHPMSEMLFEHILSKLDPYSDGIVSQPHYDLSWVFSLGTYYSVAGEPYLELQRPRTHAEALRALARINQKKALGFNQWRLPTINEFTRLFPKYEAAGSLPHPAADSPRFWSSDELGDGEKVWTFCPHSGIGEDLCMVDQKRHLVLVADRTRW